MTMIERLMLWIIAAVVFSGSAQADFRLTTTGDASGTTVLVLDTDAAYNCTGSANGGVLTANGSNLVVCEDDNATVSDGTLKQDFAPLNMAKAHRLYEVPVYSYTWSKTGEHSAGPIAQDLALAIPELRRERLGHMAYDNGQMVGYLLALVQEQHRRIEALEKK